MRLPVSAPEPQEESPAAANALRQGEAGVSALGGRQARSALATGTWRGPGAVGVPVLGTRVVLVREGSTPYTAPALAGTPAEAARIAAAYLEGADRERMIALLLDTKNRVAGIHEVATGTLDRCVVFPREVFRAAVVANARRVVLAHNHPSGDPTPSEEDAALTATVAVAGRLLGITVSDHIIVGGEGVYFSFVESGRMPQSAAEPAARRAA